MRVQAIQNGFGRFGLHMLAYYLDRAENSNFTLTHINDEKLPISKMIEIMKSDRYVRLFENYEIQIEDSTLTFIKGQSRVSIEFHNLPLNDFIEFGDGIFLECSGRYTEVQRFPASPNIEKVFISATSVSSDITAIVGFNEGAITKEHKFISYGSCTVNAFLPLASRIHSQFVVLEADVNVIHNIAEYQLASTPEIFERRSCTLSVMGPKLLDFINESNFNVNYTVVPVTGVSRIDFRFALKREFELGTVIEAIDGIRGGTGNNLYKFLEFDLGPSETLLSSYSAEFILEHSRRAGNNLYLSAYFDTENSVNRYYDLINLEMVESK